MVNVRGFSSVLLGVVVLISSSVGAVAADVYSPLKVPTEKVAEVFETSVKDSDRSREIPLRIYLPADGSAAPIVLFSHGLGGSREGSAFIGQHWAARGYVAVFLQHPGSDESVWRGKPFADRMSAMRAAAGLDNFVLRVHDVPAVLDQLEKWNTAEGNKLKGRLDLEKIGMSGHSFGAVTTQAVSGQHYPVTGNSLTDRRIKAAIAFSPSAPRAGEVDRAFGSVAIPWMLMTGTKDVAPIGEQTVEMRRSVYKALAPGSKYELVLDGAEHSIFTERRLQGDRGERNPNHRKAILALSTAFWDAYVRGDAPAKAWLDGDGPRTVLEPADIWQMK